jgi:hypothetical protein
MSGATGSSGTSGTAGEPGASGSSGTSGQNGTSGTSGANGLGLSAKSGIVQGETGYYTGTTSPQGNGWFYDVVFTQPFGSSAYTISYIYTNDSDNNPLSPVTRSASIAPNQSSTGFTVFVGTLGQQPTTRAILEWTAVANGETGVPGTSGTNGSSGTSGVSGATGSSGTSGTDGTSGTSPSGAGTSGTSGTSGGSGTSGTSGEPGATGSSGTSGINGTSGTSGGGGGGGSTTITGVTLTQTGWTYNTGSTYYEYTYTNTGITSSVAVLFTPYNSSVFTSVSANVYPYIELNYTTNTAKLTADSYPSGNITGQFIIF